MLIDTVPHSLSFGLSLFEGVFHDLTAMVNHFARRTSTKAVYIIPFDKAALIRSIYKPSDTRLPNEPHVFLSPSDIIRSPKPLSDIIPIHLAQNENFKEILRYEPTITIPIKPISHFHEFPFHIPSLPTLLQLFGIGEVFHPRTKIYLSQTESERKDAFVSGLLNCSNYKVPEFLLMPEAQDAESVEDLFRSFLSFALTLTI